MKRSTNRNSFYAGDPHCAPSSFVIAEEIIALLRKLYEAPYWKEKIEAQFLSLCKKLGSVSKDGFLVRSFGY